MFGVVLPKNPYIGQVYYDVDLKRTFRYEEKPSMAILINSTTDWCHWVDITDKDLV